MLNRKYKDYDMLTERGIDETWTEIWILPVFKVNHNHAIISLLKTFFYNKRVLQMRAPLAARHEPPNVLYVFELM